MLLDLPQICSTDNDTISKGDKEPGNLSYIIIHLKLSFFHEACICDVTGDILT